MSRYGYYTKPVDSPVSWAASRAGVIRRGEEQFEKHASKFYESGRKKKGLLSWIFGAAKKQYKPTTKFQRPGFLQGLD